MTPFFAIGLMSGTSLDGLDICYAQFSQNNASQWTYTILLAETIAYPKIWEEKLRNAATFSAEDLLDLHSEYGFYLANTVKEFRAKNSILHVDVIASHGHTIFHQPQRKFTLQIGDGRAINIINKLPVVFDFRSQDVLLGGNGAPLVPIGDFHLFSQFSACMNLGGFSNISFQKEEKRWAFDICPVNVVLNYFSQKLGFQYDHQGELARQGNVHENLLLKLNSLAFYKQNPPKSLGIEWVNTEVFPLLKTLDTKDALATFTEHAALQIAHILNRNELKSVFITGGGVYNWYLIEKIKSKTSCEIIIPSDEEIQFKEALIFAFMGVLRMQNQINVLSSATGSEKDHCSGIWLDVI